MKKIMSVKEQWLIGNLQMLLYNKMNSSGEILIEIMGNRDHITVNTREAIVLVHKETIQYRDKLPHSYRWGDKDGIEFFYSY